MRARTIMAALLLAGACDPSAFDEALDKAPVRAVGRPDNFQGDDVGRLTLPMPLAGAPADVAGWYLAAATTSGSSSIAVVDLFETGKARARGFGEAQLGLSLGAINALGRLSETSVLVGSPDYGTVTAAGGKGRVAAFSITRDAGGTPKLNLTATVDAVDEPKFGSAVAAPRMFGAAAPDWAVLAEDRVTVFAAGVATDRRQAGLAAGCDVRIEALQDIFLKRGRAMVVGDFIAGAGGAFAGEELAVGVPKVTAPPQVVLVGVGAAGTLACPVAIPAPAGAGPLFGASVAVAALDPDGVRNDLIVGAPPNAAYGFRGPFVPGVAAAPSLIFLVPAALPNDLFGYRVAGVNLDGVGGDEIVVSAPGTEVDGEAGAGRLVIFRLPNPGEPAPVVLLDRVVGFDADDNDELGASLAELRFRSGPCKDPMIAAPRESALLLAGGREEIFTYFRLPGILPMDTRCFAK